ncbi:MAG: hypothetical protein M3N08_01920 [Pseudomonadota bacterium]|nr:hypothetical protein [Pseudomonadota bacterium]
MKKFGSLFLALALMLGVTTPAAAHRVVVVTSGGYIYPGYPGYMGYPGYYPGYYVAPPPLVYAPPPYYAPVAPPVAYGQQPPPYGYAPPAYAPPAYSPPMAPNQPPPAAANQTSPTFIDNLGRTCRNYELAEGAGQAYGTACMQPDGTWQTVQ